MSVIIGVPCCEKQSYVVERFIRNQEEIKQATKTKTRLTFATEEPAFAKRLEVLLVNTSLEYDIIHFTADVGQYYKLVNITRAREAIRQHTTLGKSDYLLFVDFDIILDPDVVNVLLEEIRGYGAVYNSYLVHTGNVCTNGLGTCLIRREVLEQITFRCLIGSENPIWLYKWNAFIDECLYFELDTLSKGYRLKQGTFVTSGHYSGVLKVRWLLPAPRTRAEKVIHSWPVRRCMALFVNVAPVMLLLSVVQFWLHIRLARGDSVPR